MKNSRRFAIVLLITSLAQYACNALTPATATPQVAATTASTEAAIEATTQTEPSPEAATEQPDSTATLAASPVPKPTVEKLQLQIVQSQAWADSDGNVRANVLLRNPYDFPVAPNGGGGAKVLDSAGEFIQIDDLYFLDGISGGGGFLLPGETIAATVCFTCEEALITEPWTGVEFGITIEDATDRWEYSTDVEASVNDVSFNGDSPLFDVTGTVKNNSDGPLQRISVRVNVFNEAGNLIGAAEVSTWDVAANATASFSGYGIGQTPDGSVTYEVTAVGVNY
jgi:hypothetical protein